MREIATCKGYVVRITKDPKEYVKIFNLSFFTLVLLRFDWFRFDCSLSHSLPYPMYFLLFYDKRRLTFQSFLYLLCSLVFHPFHSFNPNWTDWTQLNRAEHSIEYLKLIKLNRDVTIKIFESCLMNCLKCIFYYFGNSFIIAQLFFSLLDLDYRWVCGGIHWIGTLFFTFGFMCFSRHFRVKSGDLMGFRSWGRADFIWLGDKKIAAHKDIGHIFPSRNSRAIRYAR